MSEAEHTDTQGKEEEGKERRRGSRKEKRSGKEVLYAASSFREILSRRSVSSSILSNRSSPNAPRTDNRARRRGGQRPALAACPCASHRQGRLTHDSSHRPRERAVSQKRCPCTSPQHPRRSHLLSHIADAYTALELSVNVCVTDAIVWSTSINFFKRSSPA